MKSAEKRAKAEAPVVTSRRDDTLGALEELRTWVLGQMVEAQHGKHVEDAGRASAYARIAVRITEMQRRGS
jgi:hypothetical protein